VGAMLFACCSHQRLYLLVEGVHSLPEPDLPDTYSLCSIPAFPKTFELKHSAGFIHQPRKWVRGKPTRVCDREDMVFAAVW
jgi:hypothetical protein